MRIKVEIVGENYDSPRYTQNKGLFLSHFRERAERKMQKRWIDNTSN